MSAPFVSVVIPVYNGERDIAALVRALRDQTYPTDRVEFLLVDNNSTDDTRQHLEKAARERGNAQLRVLVEQDIQSSYAARNTGIRSAGGTLIAFTDADCRPRPNWLMNLVRCFEMPCVGLAAGEIESLSGSSWVERYSKRRKMLSRSNTLRNGFRPYAQTANLCVRSEVFGQTGLFRPRMSTAGDADLCWRAYEHGWKLALAPDAIVDHRHRNTIGTLNEQWRRYGRGQRYLHDLYGINVERGISASKYVLELGRWLLIGLPVALHRAIRGGDFSLLADVPLTLVCLRAHKLGAREEGLNEEGRTIPCR